MKKIDIEVFFQNLNSADCGPVCIQMILNHFDINTKLADLKKGMCYEEGGTYCFDNGILALGHGLAVTLVIANPLLFKAEDRKILKTNKAIYGHVKKLARKLRAHKTPLKLFTKFLDLGGQVKIEIPKFEHIKNAIDNDQLVLALLHGGALGENEGGFHFVVVNGYKEDAVYISNPWKRARQGWFPSEDFFYAVHASTTAAVDNGSLLVIGSKN